MLLQAALLPAGVQQGLLHANCVCSQASLHADVQAAMPRSYCVGASAPGIECGTKLSSRDSRPGSKTLNAAGSAGYETLEPEEDPREVPTKVISRTLMVPVRAQTSLVDFEGRTDRASISRILGQVAPCQIIILHGKPEVSCR